MSSDGPQAVGSGGVPFECRYSGPWCQTVLSKRPDETMRTPVLWDGLQEFR
jgi:hypothetical protein